MTLLRIEAPHFVAGIVTYTEEGPPIYNYHKCAPIVRYMKGWTVTHIINYCKKKGWKCKILQES